MEDLEGVAAAAPAVNLDEAWRLSENSEALNVADADADAVGAAVEESGGALFACFKRG